MVYGDLFHFSSGFRPQIGERYFLGWNFPIGSDQRTGVAFEIEHQDCAIVIMRCHDITKSDLAEEHAGPTGPWSPHGSYARGTRRC